MPAVLPDTPAELHALLIEKDRHIDALTARLAALEEEVRLLRQRRFGRSSEQRPASPPREDALFNEAEAVAAPDASPAAPDSVRAPRGRKPLPKGVPRRRGVHELAAADRVCAGCGETRRPIGEEVSERLEVIPARFEVVEHVRLKYACRCGAGVKVAAGALAPLPGSVASASVLAQVACAKYELALPLYRQERAFAQHGLPLSRATLANWMLGAAELATPLYLALPDALRAEPVLHADETSVQVLHEPGRAAATQSYMWVYRSGAYGRPIVLYDYQMTRAAAHPRAFLDGFAGSLQVAGYAAYDAVPDITLVGCFAHARRKFDEALKALPTGAAGKASAAQEALARIGALYGIEREIADQGPEEKRAVRQARSRPLLNELGAWLETLQPQALPKSRLGQAVAYALGQWDKLLRYGDDGRLAIDNNSAERAIKPFVIGRKNRLFANTPAGAQASAILYSLIVTAQANGLVPFAYLKHVFSVLPTLKRADEVAQLLPWHVTLPQAP
jgi:transposase